MGHECSHMQEIHEGSQNYERTIYHFSIVAHTKINVVLQPTLTSMTMTLMHLGAKKKFETLPTRLVHILF